MTAYTGTRDNKRDLIGITSSTANYWTESTASSAVDEYYYNVNDLSTETDTAYEDGVEMTEGTLGSLAAGEYAFGDNDSLGYDTVYVRLASSAYTDPDDAPFEFVQVNQYAHTLLIKDIKEMLEDEGWVTQRYDTDTANHELIMLGDGYGGDESIYIGFYSYQDATNDYYNIVVAAMKGYVSGNDFEDQPGIRRATTPAHNSAIGYWISVNAARINGVLKVGTPVYEHFGVGNFLPFAPPNQYPQPLFVAGMFDGVDDSRFSDTTQEMPWRTPLQENFAIHKNDGLWYDSNSLGDLYIRTIRPLDSTIRPVEDNYVIVPLYIRDYGQNIYGELDGIYHITGFNLSVEDTMTIDGDDYVVMQDVYRTGFDDYIAMKLV